MLRTITAILIALAFTATSASADSSKRWVGVLAVQESPLVNIVIRESLGDPAVYGPELRTLLDAGQIAPAIGRYCLIPYQNGQAYESKECFSTSTGVYTMWAPAQFVSAGRAMCVEVSQNWLGIAGQVRYPRSGGGLVECRDYSENETQGQFAQTRNTAAMIVVVRAAN